MMNNAEQTTDSSEPRWFIHMLLPKTWLEYAVALVILLILIALLLPKYAGYRRQHTCLLCRMERIDYVWKYKLPTSTSTFNESACSTWYPSHVEATHQHVWVRSPIIVKLDFFGNTIGSGVNSNRLGRAIWRLTPEQQITVYENFPNPQDATVLFMSLAEPEMMRDRYDYSTIHSLHEWIEAGCVEEWQPPEVVPSSE